MTCWRPFLAFFAGTIISLNLSSSMSTPVAAKVSTQVAVSAHLLTLLSVTASPALAVQAAAQAQVPKSQDPLPDGKGKDVTKRICSGCHSVTTFSDQRHSGDEWDAILNEMVSRGLDASDEDLATIHNYLATYLGPPKQDSSNPPADSSTH
jgi:cytochrome c5